MEHTFISVHDLSLDARLLYVSKSIVDILGYSPEEVVGKSCWEYFHPDEIPFARNIHGRGVQLDRAAVLKYCQIKNKWGQWIGCECVFTIVYDVLVASTSIYKRGLKSQQRAMEAPKIRQIFSSSPLDPRYHMLSYISTKFSSEPNPHFHEPRAALFLNRFTRTSTIMFATDGLSKLLGISADELNGKSFYYCIQETCLHDAVRCLESAKANDSIAYLRFMFRDPRQDDTTDHDETMSDTHSSDQDDEDGGVHLDSHMDMDASDHAITSDSSVPRSGSGSMQGVQHGEDRASMDPASRSSSGNSTDLDHHGADAIFDQPPTAHSSTSSLPSSLAAEERRNSRQRRTFVPAPPIELEAVVSCTSDGLVVILRGARPSVPNASLRTPHRVAEPTYTHGLFASPWATQPILPDMSYPAFSPKATANPYQPTPVPVRVPASPPPSSLPPCDFMQAIRDVAVFAWSLTGINGSLARYGQGVPTGESQPPNGLPVWDPNYKGDHGGGGGGQRRNGFEPYQLHQRQRTEDQYWGSDPSPPGPDHWERAQQMKTWQGGGGAAGGGMRTVGVGNGSGDEGRQREEWARGGRG